MTLEQRAELYWVYFISHERTVKRLLEKGILDQESADGFLKKLYDNTQEKDVLEFSTSKGFRQTVDLYLRGRITGNQYVSLTDIAREENSESPSYVIQGWLRSRNTLEFMKIWESRNNPKCDERECKALLEAMKAPSFTVTPKQWIVKTKAIGLMSKQGKGGGTFAHPDIAMDFQAPCLPAWPIQKIKLQGKINGVETDDLIVFIKSPFGDEARKLIGQVKRTIRFTANIELGEIIQAAQWIFRRLIAQKSATYCSSSCSKRLA